MANLCITVTGTNQNGTQMYVTFSVAADSGHQISSEAAVTPARTASQINGDIEARARQVMLEAYGVTVASGERVQLFGGAA